MPLSDLALAARHLGAGDTSAAVEAVGRALVECAELLEGIRAAQAAAKARRTDDRDARLWLAWRLGLPGDEQVAEMRRIRQALAVRRGEAAGGDGEGARTGEEGGGLVLARVEGTDAAEGR